MRLGAQDAALSAIGWRMAEQANGLRAGSLVDVAFAIERDDYRGGLQLKLEDFRAAEAASA